ncbi:alpha/beta fold hydrolase [Eubacterium xylanophilum]|uniref:alpha/beta fold hydrolase n=1 Tax=Eubacterium xylanophilum TaxID=39497 RepID=UPI00047D6571|nr:alpha/beta hydrolase [Eubacterium xylanophilum]
MIEKILHSESGDVHYWISESVNNEALSLFFLHGLTATHELFINQVNYFEKEYNVIVWDAPAHGLSRPYCNFSYEKAANDAVNILKENRIESAVFIGQSMGGYMAQSVIKRFPNYVKAFVSIDSTPFGEKYYSKFDRWILKHFEGMAKMYPDKSLRKAIAKQNTNSKHAYDNMYKMVSIYDKAELCHLMAVGYAGFMEDNSDIHIDCPVLLIVGECDNTGKVHKYNKEWAKDINVPITWIKDAAHNSNDDQPEQVNRCIKEFLISIVD